MPNKSRVNLCTQKRFGDKQKLWLKSPMEFNREQFTILDGTLGYHIRDLMKTSFNLL